MKYTRWMTVTLVSVLGAAFIGLFWLLSDLEPYDSESGLEYHDWVASLPAMERLGARRAGNRTFWFYRFKDHRGKECLVMAANSAYGVGIDCD